MVYENHSVNFSEIPASKWNILEQKQPVLFQKRTKDLQYLHNQPLSSLSERIAIFISLNNIMGYGIQENG